MRTSCKLLAKALVFTAFTALTIGIGGPGCQDALAQPGKIGAAKSKRAYLSVLTQPGSSEVAQKFDKGFDDYLSEYFRVNPNAATEMGVHTHDSQMGDVTRAGIEREVAWLKESLKKFEGIDRSKLPLNKAHDYDMVVASIKGQLLDIEQIAGWKNNPDTYSSAATASIFSLIKRDFAPVKDRMVNAIAREKQIPAMLAAAKQNIEVDKVPKIYAEIALEQMPGIIDFFVTSVPRAFVEVKDEPLKAEFDKVNKEVIGSLTEYQKFIKSEVLPNAKGSFAIGSKKYAQKLLYDEMIDEPLETLHKRGYDELHRLQADFERVGKEIDSKRKPMEVFTEIASNHPKPDNLIPEVKKVLEDIRSFCIDANICTVPGEERATVEETPAFMRALTFASMDTPGPFEKKAKEAYYHVTLPEKNWNSEKTEEHMRTFSYPDILNTSVHEAYPGHYVQFLWVNRAPSKVRQVMSCGSNGEGWAHYCEQMMLDEGFGKGDRKLRMVQIHDALLRACRYIAGLEMHTRGMSLQSAVDLFMKEGYQEKTNAEREAKRGTMDPTYLVYTLGKLEILDLKEKYKQLSGTKYSLKDFHDWFLSLGCPQLKIAREELKYHLLPLSNAKTPATVLAADRSARDGSAEAPVEPQSSKASKREADEESSNPEAQPSQSQAPDGSSAFSWSNNLDRSLEEAKALNKFVLADVYTEWCGWCHKLDKDTFSDPTMVNYLKEKFIGVKVDAEEPKAGRAIARKYRIHGYPCALVFEPSGKFIGKISGYYEANDYKQAIDNLLKHPPADPFDEQE